MGLGTDSKLFGVGSDYAGTGGVDPVQGLGSPQRGDGSRPQENYVYLTADGPLAVADERHFQWLPTSIRGKDRAPSGPFLWGLPSRVLQNPNKTRGAPGRT